MGNVKERWETMWGMIENIKNAGIWCEEGWEMTSGTMWNIEECWEMIWNIQERWEMMWRTMGITIYKSVILVDSVIKFLDRNLIIVEKVQAFLDLINQKGENHRDLEKS